MIILIALFVISWSLFIFFVVKNKRFLGFYFKGLTSFLFVSTFAYGVYRYFVLENIFSFPSLDTTTLSISEITFAILIFIGLVAGLIGDLFLEMMHVDKTRDKYTIITFGMIIFLIGHLFYIVGLSIIAEFNYLSLIIGAVMVIVVYIGTKLMKLNMGKVEILSYVYTFVIFTMIGQAIMNGFLFNFNTFSLVFMIGAILFGISDLLLAPLYFGGKTSNVFVVSNLGTYYVGQLLIALAIYFL